MPLDEAAKLEALQIAQRLRPAFRVEMAYAPKSPRKGLEEALKREARFVGLLGEAERARGVVTLKHLETGDQREVSWEALGEALGPVPGVRL